MSKIHLSVGGLPRCGCHKRWGCSVITTIKNIARVTCRNCLRLAA